MRKESKSSSYFLILTTITGLVLLPFAIIKRPLKDWIIVYIVSVLENYFADYYLVARGYLRYKKKLFPRLKVHLPFDFVHYPLILLYYNQWTLNSKPMGLVFKLFPFVIPLIIIETFAAKYTKLITWKKGWSWHHSMISVMVKILLCRSIIAMIRKLNTGKLS
ncbi:MAG: CBO0543 family protein [Anaerobacillus sp.]|uniref:CBO0543 family protein n=1 Tax=Anaerobacillus sp. TaxID=1872506 RepID=UPI00391C7F5F